MRDRVSAPPGRRRNAKRLLAEQDALPLLHRTPDSWAELAARELPVFLADHAVCEQQAALSALNLVAHYPGDAELVERLSALAAEEIMHLRRVSALLRARGLEPARRRGNPYVQALRRRIDGAREPGLKIDRLLVGALIEARSCERFTRLLGVIDARDPQVAELLFDLGPAERRHWELFWHLAAREVDRGRLQVRWREWLEFEARINAGGGKAARVHG